MASLSSLARLPLVPQNNENVRQGRQNVYQLEMRINVPGLLVV